MERECANPLLLQFLKGWWGEASGFNSKGASTYKRAYESMRACPIPFEHPSQAIELNGFGPKLCERLTKTMEKYCADHGLPVPRLPKKNCPNQSRKRTVMDTGADGNVNTPPTPPNPKRPRKMKDYIPAYRSGGYALLVALHQAVDDMLTKEQLIDMAQCHCDSSFTVPSDPSKHYTAWGSIKTLMEKNLVYGGGNPKRYCLTDVGDQVAAAAVAGINSVAGRSSLNTQDASAAARGSRAPGRNTKTTTASKNVGQDRPPPGPSGAPPRLGDTRPLLDSDDEEDFRRISGRAQAIRVQTKEPESMVDLVTQRERLQALYSGKSLEYGKDRRESHPIRQERHISPLPIDIEDLTSSPPPPSLQPPALRTLSKSSSNIQSTANYGNSKSPPSKLHVPSIYKPLIPLTHSETRIASIVCSQPQYPPPTLSIPIHTHPPPHSQSQQPSNPSKFPFFTPEVLIPGTFTIHLLLDNREVRAKHDRDYIQNSLSTAGITPLTRALPVGDAMWIARENTSPNREVVLDYIVERKRLDDLIASIKDGRFHDQKFRLTKSGVKNITYIIEDYSLGDAGNMQEAIETAVSSTQVVNGFFVKRTAKLDDTIRYLVRMTKMLEGVYARQPLPLIPSNLIQSRTYPTLFAYLSMTFPTLHFHPTYVDFSSLVSKSGALTLRDVYLKMLMCVRGISIEKAAEIQKRYPTPRVLVEAYESCEGDKEKLEMITRALEGQIGRKKVGGALSGKIAEVWAGMGFDGDGK